MLPLGGIHGKSIQYLAVMFLTTVWTYNLKYLNEKKKNLGTYNIDKSPKNYAEYTKKTKKECIPYDSIHIKL